jgi:hypothetical protein
MRARGTDQKHSGANGYQAEESPASSHSEESPFLRRRNGLMASSVMGTSFRH